LTNPRKRASTHIDYLSSPCGTAACWASVNQRSSVWLMEHPGCYHQGLQNPLHKSWWN